VVDKAVVELVEADLQVPPPRATGPAALETPGPVAVESLEMDRVDGVLLALKPVAGYLRQADVHEAVVEGEGLPIRDQGRGLRTQVGP
jgi:hypothetical protein